MSGVNRVILIGRLGRDPEIKYSQQGTAICNMAVATSEQWSDKTTGEKQEKTEWHRVITFGKQAETCEKYLTKGSHIYIEGRLQTRSWEKDGQTHYTTEIVVSNFMFLGGGQQTGCENKQPQNGYQQQNRQPSQKQHRQQNQNQGDQHNQNNATYDDSSDIPF